MLVKIRNSQWPNENSYRWIKNVTLSSKTNVLYCSVNRYVHIFFISWLFSNHDGNK